MLLVQVSKGISEPGQAYRMGILAKIVNGVKFILRLIWWTLRVYLFGHLDQWYEWSNWSEHWKKTICFVLSLGIWPIRCRVITGFTKLLGSLGSLVFYLFLVSVSFAYTSRNPMSMEFRVYTIDKKPKTLYVIKCTSDLCQLLNGLISWMTKVHLFVINFSHYLDQRISDTFFQTNSPLQMSNI